MIAIYKRELSSYFNSMIGYVFIAALVCFTGIYFMAYNLYSGFPDFSYALMSLMNILMFTVPILTMRSMAEDRRAAPTSSFSPRRCPCGRWCWANTWPW